MIHPLRRLAFAAGMVVACGTAAHADLSCLSSIAGSTLTLTYSPDDPIRSLSTARERMWTDRKTCLGFVPLHYLTPDLTDDQRAGKCLLYDPKGKTIVGVATGKRDAFQHCHQPGRFCRFVGKTRDAAVGATDAALGLADRTARLSDESGLTAVLHGPGGVLLTGGSGYLAGTIGTAATSAATTAATVAASPAVLVGTGVAAVSVGGALLFCAR